MGCMNSKPVEDVEAKERNASIEKQLKVDQQQMRKQVKILLLGAGESGKSTIVKQMKLIHEGAYTREERESFKSCIYTNTVQSMSVILDAMEQLGIEFGSPSTSRDHAELVLTVDSQFDDESEFDAKLQNAIRELWRDEGLRACFKRSNEFQLNDSASYYFDSIDRISAPDWIPNDQDVLRSRVKTTGILEHAFQVGDITHRVFDVGGQRSERKKWIHCFEGVNALLFVVSLSEYDQTLYEDESVNRMAEALVLFESIANSRWFAKSSIILFMNKVDLLREKLPRSPVEAHFPEFTGGQDLKAACEYFSNRFRRQCRTEDKAIYVHVTCATDTNAMRVVLAAIEDNIIRQNLNALGLL